MGEMKALEDARNTASVAYMYSRWVISPVDRPMHRFNWRGYVYTPFVANEPVVLRETHLCLQVSSVFSYSYCMLGF